MNSTFNEAGITLQIKFKTNQHRHKGNTSLHAQDTSVHVF